MKNYASGGANISERTHSTSPAGTKIGISAAEQSHQRRTYGIVLLIPTVFLAGVLAAVLIRTLRRWRPSRR